MQLPYHPPACDLLTGITWQDIREHAWRSVKQVQPGTNDVYAFTEGPYFYSHDLVTLALYVLPLGHGFIIDKIIRNDSSAGISLWNSMGVFEYDSQLRNYGMEEATASLCLNEVPISTLLLTIAGLTGKNWSNGILYKYPECGLVMSVLRRL
jgi:hypothetical protein